MSNNPNAKTTNYATPLTEHEVSGYPSYDILNNPDFQPIESIVRKIDAHLGLSEGVSTTSYRLSYSYDENGVKMTLTGRSSDFDTDTLNKLHETLKNLSGSKHPKTEEQFFKDISSKSGERDGALFFEVSFHPKNLTIGTAAATEMCENAAKAHAEIESAQQASPATSGKKSNPSAAR